MAGKIKEEKRGEKKKIITDKFSLLETILIGFFIMLVLREKKEKLCHSRAFFK